MLQLLHVTQAFHPGTVPVDIATRHGPPRRDHGKPFESRLTQILFLVPVQFEIARTPRHIARVLHVWISRRPRFYGVDHGDPSVEASAIVEVAHRRRTVLPPELADQILYRLLELAIQRDHPAAHVGPDAELARRQRRVVNHIVKVLAYHRGPRAEGAKFFVPGVQCAIGVRSREDVEKESRHIGKPNLDGRVLIQLPVRSGKAKPGPRGRCGARHHPRTENPQGPRPGVVVDVVVPPPSLVAVLHEEPPGARQQKRTDLLPVHPPTGAFRLERTPPRDELVARYDVGAPGLVRHVTRPGASYGRAATPTGRCLPDR